MLVGVSGLKIGRLAGKLTSQDNHHFHIYFQQYLFEFPVFILHVHNIAPVQTWLVPLEVF